MAEDKIRYDLNAYPIICKSCNRENHILNSICWYCKKIMVEDGGR